jgi:uncharacterized protein YigA (DUF484 family)
MKEEHATPLRMRETQAEPELATEDVLAYLGRHPDFFLRHEQVLCDLELPHRAGTAVSLVERQVSLLRERNIESRTRLNRLLEHARDNDELFTKTRQLVLGLLEARTLEQLAQTLMQSIRREFGVEHCRLLLVEDGDTHWSEGGERVMRGEAEATLKSMFRPGKPIVGPLRPQERALLFAADAEAVHSAVMVPVGAEKPIALLAAGSSDARRFHGEMGTLFMEFIGDALQRLLPRFRQP